MRRTPSPPKTTTLRRPSLFHPYILENLLRTGLQLITYATVLATLYLLGDIVLKGLPALSWEFITGFPQKSGASGGIFPAILGTCLLVLTALAVALPLGVASALYLSEFAPQNRLTRLIRLAILTLAGVPSIVYGLFGLALFVLMMGFGPSILAGGLTLACMILPTIIVTSEEALRAVPSSLREGSLALGASQTQTVFLNVLPYALPGILTGSILAIGRAAGETAPILLTVAAFYLPCLPLSLLDQVMALPYHLYVLATQHPDPVAARPMQYGTALVLLILVLGMSGIAQVFRYRCRENIKW